MLDVYSSFCFNRYRSEIKEIKKKMTDIKFLRRNSKEAKSLLNNLSHGISSNINHENRYISAEDILEQLKPRDKIGFNSLKKSYAIYPEYGGCIILFTK